MSHLLINQSSFNLPQVFSTNSGAMYFSKKSIDKDTPNEDSLLIIEIDKEHHILAIADGAGGYPKGEEASLKCLEEILRTLKNCGLKSSYRSEILDGIESANERLIADGVGERTTLSIIEHTKGFARSYQVGDSTAFICGQRSKLKFRSTSHSPVGYELEAGIIDEKEALLHPDLNIISNLVGESEMKIEIGPKVSINPNDTLFLATDGLFDNFQTESIIDIVRKGSALEAAKELIRQIDRNIYNNAEAKQDDLSFILFRP